MHTAFIAGNLLKDDYTLKSPLPPLTWQIDPSALNILQNHLTSVVSGPENGKIKWIQA